MKRILALVLTAALMLTLSACGEKADASNAIVLGPGEVQTPGVRDGLLLFELEIENPTNEALDINRLEIIHRLAGEQVGDTVLFQGEQLSYIGLNQGELQPGARQFFSITRPRADAFDTVEFRVALQRPSGGELFYREVFQVSPQEEAPAAASGPVQEEGADGYLQPMVIGADWRFEIALANDGEEPLTLESLEIFHIQNGEVLDPIYPFTGADLEQIGLGFGTLAPGDTVMWADNHPIVPDFNEAEYRFTFTDGRGESVVKCFRYRMDGEGQDSPQTNAQPPAPVPEGYLVPQYQNGTDWRFEIELLNEGETPLTLETLEIFHRKDGQDIQEPVSFGPEDFGRIGLGFGTLNPGEGHLWQDNHPIVTDFNEAEYRFTFTDGGGETVVKRFCYALSTEPSLPDYSGDGGKDLGTLRYQAAFEAEVNPGVFWVPARVLGDSRYTNGEIYAMLSASPQEKQEAISTVYEALQLYQIGGFYSSDDNIRMREDGVNWEHHKPGYDAVRTNTGCCATDSNWLNYLLREDYEEVGFIATSQRDGSGHIYNYLKEDGFYYFIDLTHYRTDWIATAVEDGDMDSYYRSDFVLGNIHKAQSVQAFVDYVQWAFGDPPGLMFQYRAEDCLAIDSVANGGKMTITYEEVPGVEVAVIFDDPGDSLEYTFEPSPRQLPDWSSNPSYSFPG